MQVNGVEVETNQILDQDIAASLTTLSLRVKRYAIQGGGYRKSARLPLELTGKRNRDSGLVPN